eukprot:CAMPEP_0170554512 /NCGR_PEP_ID=MMETSP0211-20121228/12357_1 /TAXON_ID=311385 /ORGANISM="Pseudokeronopsis sp., Strain OXSARD2" /LENGTH=98 /DNA_ID=CAMNT_0010863619 /DNA_START=1272 /DNA_END=1565 /DNA_ORIENTATION=+
MPKILEEKFEEEKVSREFSSKEVEEDMVDQVKIFKSSILEAISERHQKNNPYFNRGLGLIKKDLHPQIYTVETRKRKYHAIAGIINEEIKWEQIKKRK